MYNGGIHLEWACHVLQTDNKKPLNIENYLPDLNKIWFDDQCLLSQINFCEIQFRFRVHVPRVLVKFKPATNF